MGRPFRFRCIHHGNPMVGFEFSSDNGVCPQCGRSGFPHVQPLHFIHWQMPDPHGPFTAPDGTRTSIACERKRDYFAPSQLPEHAYGATPVLQAVTCPSCMGVPLFKTMAQALGLLPRESMTAIASGCCG